MSLGLAFTLAVNLNVFSTFIYLKMSQLDTELTLLKQKLAALEEQKRIELEKEAEKKENPLKVLEEFIDETKKVSNMLALWYPQGVPSPQIQMLQSRRAQGYVLRPEDIIWLCDQNDKVKFLEPIFNMLQDIQKRLDALEKKETNLLEGLIL